MLYVGIRKKKILNKGQGLNPDLQYMYYCLKINLNLSVL